MRINRWFISSFRTRAVLPFLAMLYLAGVFSSCIQEDKGEVLARRYCASCHMFPDPALLEKETWTTQVLPEMAFRMGLDISQFHRMNEAELPVIMKSIPSTPMVTDEEWAAIVEYYADTAPDSLRAEKTDAIQTLDQFSPADILIPGAGSTMLTMIERDPKTGLFYVGTRNAKLYLLNPALSAIDSLDVRTPASDIVFSGGPGLLTCMGIMDPNDQARGTIVRLGESNNPSVIIDSITRPVHMEVADLNRDGEDDLLVSAFGNFTGGLYAYERTENGFRRHTLHRFPGTRRTAVHDFNGDGLSDLVALVTQGDEHIALFTNRGDFRFSYQVLLKFPPVYGSSYFELLDFDGDGHLDILYTNGDNADYSTVLKPYHGVRLFMNDGKNHFSESWHHPMHGASMAKAVDFDLDGDLDIAAISFFPDFEKHPEHSFIYFENQNGKFIPYSTPMAAAGRWITMETTDIDGDGDVDIVLAALNFPTGVPEKVLSTWQKNKVSLLLLKNNHER